MIFHYLYPDLGDIHELQKIVAAVHAYNIAGPFEKTAAVAELGFVLRPLFGAYVHDMLELRVDPQFDDLYYRNPTLMARYRQAGKLTEFFGPNDAWTLEDLLVQQ